MTCRCCEQPALVRLIWGPIREQRGEFCREHARQCQAMMSPQTTDRLLVEPL